jgi:hypothetical protein
MTQDGTRLAEHMRRARGLLAGAECPGWEDRVDTVKTNTGEALLIRPDGYVAWAGSTGQGEEGLRDALGRWFGPPAADVHLP